MIKSEFENGNFKHIRPEFYGVRNDYEFTPRSNMSAEEMADIKFWIERFESVLRDFNAMYDRYSAQEKS